MHGLKLGKVVDIWGFLLIVGKFVGDPLSGRVVWCRLVVLGYVEEVSGNVVLSSSVLRISGQLCYTWLCFPVARTPDLRWLRPPGRMLPCRLSILPSFVVVLSRWPVRGPNRSLRWRRICGFLSRACGIWVAQADADGRGSQARLTSAEKEELAQLRRDRRR